MSKPNQKPEEEKEPKDELGDLMDVAEEVDTDKPSKNDPKNTITSDSGEVISLNNNPDKVKRKGCEHCGK